MINNLILGQRVDQNRELAPVLGEPAKCASKVLDGDPGLEAADDVWAQRGGVDPSAPGLQHDVEVALLDEGFDLGAKGAGGGDGVGVGLEEVGVEVEFLDLLGVSGGEDVGGRQGGGSGGFSDCGGHGLECVELSVVEWSVWEGLDGLLGLLDCLLA